MARTSKTGETMNMEYSQNGVMVMPDMPDVGMEMKVMYDGLLYRSGASHVYAYVGYGADWRNKELFRMDKEESAFGVSIPVMEVDVVSICFKDCANNWDNNSGMNYTFPIRNQ